MSPRTSAPSPQGTAPFCQLTWRHPITIGRSPCSHARLDCLYLSTEHCQLRISSVSSSISFLRNARATYVTRSVCVLVTPVCCAATAEPIEMPFGGLTCMDPRNHYYMGTAIPTTVIGNWGLSGPFKNTGNLRCGVCSKTDHLIINNGMAAWLLQPTAMLLTLTTC